MSNGVNNGDKLTGKRHFEDANEFGRRDYMSALGSNKSASKEIELADDEEYIRLYNTTTLYLKSAKRIPQIQ